jgi:hypothetical protein
MDGWALGEEGRNTYSRTVYPTDPQRALWMGSLTGLTAATVYFYALRSAGDVVEGTERACHAWLKTHPPHGDTGALRFWALGDSGSANQHQQLTFQAYRTFVGE